MLEKSTLTLASVLAGTLTKKGIGVSPKENTPVARLVSTMDVPPLPVVSSMESHEAVDAIYDLSANFSFENDDGKKEIYYNKVLDEIVEETVPMFKEFLETFNTCVKGLVKDLIALVEDNLTSADPVETAQIQLKEAKIPDILTNQSFIELINRFKAPLASNNPIPKGITFPEIPLAELREDFLKVSVIAEDTVKLLADNQNLDADTYSSIFLKQSKYADNLLFNLSGTEKIETAIATFIFTMVFLEDAPQGVVATPEQLRDGLYFIRGQAALAVYNYMANMERSYQNKQMVISRNGKTLVLNPRLYQDFLNEGNEKEVLYGLAIDDTRENHIERITLNKDKYLDKWKRHVEYLSSTNNSYYLAKFKQYLSLGFKDLIKDPKYANLGTENVKAIQTFNQMVTSLTLKDIAHIDQCVIKLVCMSKFKDMRAYEFFTYLDNSAQTKEDCLYLACAKYLTDWVKSQLVFKAGVHEL